MMSGTVGPSNVRFPESISARQHPNAQMSQRSSHSSPRTCSGDM